MRKTMILFGILSAVGCSVEPESTTLEVGEANHEIRSDEPVTGTLVLGYVLSKNGVADPDFTPLGGTFITKGSTGLYTVTFGGAGKSGQGGNVQVVAYGASSTRCNVQSWGQSGIDQVAQVRCYNASGALTDSDFFARFVKAHGLNAGAYLWANQPSADSYVPSSTWSYNSTNGVNTITRAGTGNYTARLPGLGVQFGNVMVTAHGSGSGYCTVASWLTSGVDKEVNVRCWSATGAAVDSTYSLVFDGSTQTGFIDMGGFAWTLNTNGAPSALYSYNSGGDECHTGVVQGGKNAIGNYYLRFSLLGFHHTSPHVTAYGSSPMYCKIASFKNWFSGAEIMAQCYDSSGTAVDAQYAASLYSMASLAPC